MLCYLFLTKHRELPHGGVCPRCCANISSPKKCPRCYAIYELDTGYWILDTRFWIYWMIISRCHSVPERDPVSG